jgi:hypothetical protein
MIKIICGQKGKGKTKHLLDAANEAVKNSTGAVVYLDKSAKHTYELNNQIRLIDMSEYPVSTYEGFLGFVSGLLSGNHDINVVLFDSFLKISALEGKDITDAIKALDNLGGDDVEFILSVSMDEAQLPEAAKEKISISC